MSKQRTFIMFAIAAAIGVIASESAARFFFGLGDPPLIIRDGKIDYLFKPSTTYFRFGNKVYYNSLSMRAREPRTKKSNCEPRILALGDSVVNGGSQTDQSQLATDLLEKRLSTDLLRHVWVGNASAGGWAPGHMKAYIEKFGWLSADVVLLVLNTHDVKQGMLFVSKMGPDFPTETPRLALVEAVTRYMPRYLPILRETQDFEAGAREQLNGEDEAPSAISWLLQSAHSAGASVVVIHNRERDELAPLKADDWREAAASKLKNLVLEAHAEYVDFGPIEHDVKSHPSPYRDDIHLNAFGQSLLADAMYKATIARLKAIVSGQPTECDLSR